MSDVVTIYHNPRCGTSRRTLDLLQERGIAPRVVEYLKTPLTAGELAALVEKLGVAPRALVRAKEGAEFGAGDLPDTDLLGLIALHPSIMQRPIVVVGDHARIGRPAEAVLEILPPQAG